MCSAIGDFDFFFFAESSSTSTEPSQLLCSCSFFLYQHFSYYNSREQCPEYSGPTRESSTRTQKQCLFHLPSCTRENWSKRNCCMSTKTSFVEIHGGRSWPFCWRPLLDNAVECFPCVFKIYIKCTVYTFTWLYIASCLQLCAILQLFISELVTIARILKRQICNTVL